MKSPALNTVLVLALALIAVVGMVGLVILSVRGRPTDTTLVAVLFTVVGALAGALRGQADTTNNMLNVASVDPKQEAPKP